LKLGQIARPLLPGRVKRKVPQKVHKVVWPASTHQRKMLVLEGCVQPALSPNTNAAAARVLNKLGISLVRAPQAGCCGAVSYHLNAQDEGLDYMRRNIDAWWPYVEQGVEAIIVTASGCASMIAEYGHLLRNDPAYRDKALRISTLMKDISEIILAEKEKINQEIEEFVTSDNIYYQEYKPQANELLASLKSGSFTYNKSPDADAFP
jgi:glycolate oxidase iron-sulfur subunit